MRHADTLLRRLQLLSGCLLIVGTVSLGMDLTVASVPARAEEAPAAPSAKTAVATVAEADRLLSAGDIKTAARSYLRAAEAAPGEPVYRIMAGVALASAGRMNEALSAFRRADKLSGGTDVLASLLIQGVLSERSDDSAEAQAIYTRTIQRFSRPGVPGLYTAASTERLLKAQKQFEQSPVLALLIGDSYQLAQQWQKSEESYQKAIRLAPRWVKPRINLGLCLLAKGNSAEAIAAFQGALALDPANAQAQIAKADAQLQLGFVDDAVVSYRKVENSTNNRVAAQAATGIGQAYAQRGQVADAVRSLNRAQQLNPSDPTPAVALGEVQSRAGNYPAAAAAYNEALRLSGRGLFASKGILYRTLAETQLSAHDSVGAIATVRRALADEPGSRPLWYRLWAQALYLSGDAPGGEAKLRQALESDGNRYPLDTLNAASARGLIPKLTADYTARLNSDGNDAAKITILRSLAHLARFQHKSEDELMYRTKLTALHATGPEWFALADAQERGGDPKSAQASYQKALQLGGLSAGDQRLARQRIKS